MICTRVPQQTVHLSFFAVQYLIRFTKCLFVVVVWCHGTIQQDADQHNSRESSNKNNDVYQYHIVVCCVPSVKLRINVTRTFRVSKIVRVASAREIYIFNFTRNAQVACLREKDKL